MLISTASGSSSTADSSLMSKRFIDKYLKLKVNGSACFFSKDRIKKNQKKELRGYLNKKGNYLFRFDSSPMTKEPSLSKKQFNEIKGIRRVKNFTLKKWDTGEMDTFDLYFSIVGGSGCVSDLVLC